MKLLTKLKQLSRKSIFLGAITAATLGTGLFATTIADASSGANCDSNAVVYCGATSTSNLINKYNNGDGHNSAASIHNIYDSKSFNISAADVSSMKTDAVSGTVTKSGDVIVNGNVVATGALTAGRQNIKGSTKETNDGTTFYTRTPSVSFLDSSLSAMVDMKNGVFQFAVINSCGNPVVAHPKKPNYTVTKLVSVKGADNFKNNITVTPGDHVEYKITVTSTGAVAAKNITVNDNLPKGVTEVANSLTRNDPGSSSAVNGNDSKFFGNGVNIASLAPGQSVIFKFEAVVGSKDNDTQPKCNNESLNNEAVINAPGLPKEHNGAVVNTKCLPKPPAPAKQVLTCNSLTPTTDSRTKFTFNAAATAKNGATITGYTYNFGDGTTQTNTTSAATNSINHSYAAAGTYTITVNVLGTLNGKATTVTSATCQTKVTVSPPPAAECTELTATQNGNNSLAFNAAATYSPSNANLTAASFDWGDGTTTQGTKGGPGEIESDHTYAAAGTYTITATLSFSSPDGTIPNSNCSTVININIPQQPAYTCDALTITQGDNRTVTVTGLQTTATNGAVFSSADINWGDGNTDTGLTNAIGDTHQYAADGTYTITAVAHFTVDGQDITASSDGCTQQVSFSTPPVTPPTTPTPPSALVNTGAGNVIGLFAAATIFGTVAYRWFLGRRLSREG